MMKLILILVSELNFNFVVVRNAFVHDETDFGVDVDEIGSNFNPDID